MKQRICLHQIIRRRGSSIGGSIPSSCRCSSFNSILLTVLIASGVSITANIGVNAQQSTNNSVISPSAKLNTKSLISRTKISSPKLGDHKRCEESSASFFQSVDSDGDGLLERLELKNFLKDSIGGTNFDEEEEVNHGAKDVIDKFDFRKDDVLDIEEMISHWERLEKLLGVQETAEWIEHAVQMPKDIVRKFQDHGVTGFDFPELIEDNGKRIFQELQITSDRSRQKILRLIRARLLGIGSEPTIPQNVNVEVEGCSAVLLKWEASKAESFPVHKYRVQRRLVADTAGYSDWNLISGNDDGNINKTRKNNYDFETIHANAETMKVDLVLSDECKKYSYRIEAWNAVGRSGWVEVDVQCGNEKGSTMSHFFIIFVIHSAFIALIFNILSSHHKSYDKGVVGDPPFEEKNTLVQPDTGDESSISALKQNQSTVVSPRGLSPPNDLSQKQQEQEKEEEQEQTNPKQPRVNLQKIKTVKKSTSSVLQYTSQKQQKETTNLRQRITNAKSLPENFSHINKL